MYNSTILTTQDLRYRNVHFTQFDNCTLLSKGEVIIR